MRPTGQGSEIKLPSFNVLLTPFDFLRADFDFFCSTEWLAMIIDEGQKMKNNNSSFFKKCMTIHAQFRVLLSGTPLQNNIEELYNLLEFLDPKQFGNAFKERMHNLKTGNILSVNDSKHTKTADDAKPTDDAKPACEAKPADNPEAE